MGVYPNCHIRLATTIGRVGRAAKTVTLPTTRASSARSKMDIGLGSSTRSGAGAHLRERLELPIRMFTTSSPCLAAYTAPTVRRKVFVARTWNRAQLVRLGDGTPRWYMPTTCACWQTRPADTVDPGGLKRRCMSLSCWPRTAFDGASSVCLRHARPRQSRESTRSSRPGQRDRKWRIRVRVGFAGHLRSVGLSSLLTRRPS